MYDLRVNFLRHCILVWFPCLWRDWILIWSANQRSLENESLRLTRRHFLPWQRMEKGNCWWLKKKTLNYKWPEWYDRNELWAGSNQMVLKTGKREGKFSVLNVRKAKKNDSTNYKDLFFMKAECFFISKCYYSEC